MQMYAQALLSVARFSITLGEAERALAHLAAAQPLHQFFDAASQASWHEVRGETHAVLGNAAAALSEFRAAARLAAQSGVSELIAQIENNFALAAFDLGDFDLAVARHQIALDEAERTGLTWRVAYSSLNYARTLLYKGELSRARAYVWAALKDGVTTATFKTKAASVGIPLGLLLNDRAMLEACADTSAIELASRSGEIQRIASVSAAFASLRIAQGSASEAQALIADAVRSISHAHRAWDLFTAIAAWGSAEDVVIARCLLNGTTGRPRVKRAYRLLFEAMTSRNDNVVRAARLGRLAARHFERMGNVLCQAIALEAADERDRALEIYRAIGAVNDAQRLSQAIAPARELCLTQRQKQIAQLVALGETNRAIAQQLHISEHTVEHHVSAIFERLGLRSRAQLAHMLGQYTI
jgi:DNA-binding NarL/FixJ family response regulator